MSKVVDGIVTTAKPLTVINFGQGGNPKQIYGPPDSNTPVHFKKSGLLSHRSAPILDSVSIARPQTGEVIRQRFDQQIVDDQGFFNENLNPMHPSILSPERTLIMFSINANRTWTLPTSESLILWLKSVYGEDNIYAGMSWEIRFHNFGTTALTFVQIAEPVGGNLSAFRGIPDLINQAAFVNGTLNGTPTFTLRIVLTSVENTLANPYSYSAYMTI